MTRHGLSAAGVAVGVKGGCHAGSPGKVIDRASPEEKRSGEDSDGNGERRGRAGGGRAGGRKRKTEKEAVARRRRGMVDRGLERKMSAARGDVDRDGGRGDNAACVIRKQPLRPPSQIPLDCTRPVLPGAGMKWP